MGIAFATYSLTFVFASVPFLLSMGKTYFGLAHGQVHMAFAYGLGEWYFIGITLSIASILVAIDTTLPNTKGKTGSLIIMLSVWSGISGLLCLVGFTIYTIGQDSVLSDNGYLSINIALATFLVLITVATNGLTYIKIRVNQSAS